jgi:hypothetical protein
VLGPCYRKIGHALIISHEKFADLWNDKNGDVQEYSPGERLGNTADVNSLRACLETFKFQVHEELDPSVAGVKDAIEKCE